MARFRRKTCLTLTGLILVIFGLIIILKSLRPEGSGFGSPFGLGLFPYLGREEVVKNQPQHPVETDRISSQAQPEQQGSKMDVVLSHFPAPNYRLHVFYYSWYGNPQFDGKYIHWDHPVLQHWDPKVAARYPKGKHSPPDDIGANFYPALGVYSSRDPSVIEAHMQQIRTAAIGVLALSWYPPALKDDNGDTTDEIVPLILDTAQKYQVKVVFHIEPYKGRDDISMYRNVKYIMERYGQHPAFYRQQTSSGRFLPLFYVYDSYLSSPETWASLLKDSGRHTVRNTPFDGLFIALLVEDKHRRDILAAGFDGVYTYFATNGFSHGVGPGYIDTSIRPWNFQNTRNRINRKYYETAFAAALEARADIISITSFNEWHEGTQIEKAVPKTVGQMKYEDYLPHRPEAYLEMTQKWAEKFNREREQWLV
ncbi:hypothetical protein GJAV_G00022700 [Gymnothorax javanicus]|nr:hypothetical protein GJAV_G00022700 [Gymnothorax javanicus]